MKENKQMVQPNVVQYSNKLLNVPLFNSDMNKIM